MHQPCQKVVACFCVKKVKSTFTFRFSTESSFRLKDASNNEGQSRQLLFGKKLKLILQKWSQTL